MHSLWGVGPSEIWAIDQAATGSVQTYEVFSKCAAKEASPIAPLGYVSAD